MKKIGVLNIEQKNDIAKSLQTQIDAQQYDLELTSTNLEENFSNLNALVIPRGKSLLYSEILFNEDIKNKIISFVESGKPILLICGSMIVFMKNFGKECDGRKSFKLINAKMDNNVYNGNMKVQLLDEDTIKGNFTDAPRIYELGVEVKAVAFMDKEVTGIRQNNIFAFTYFDESGKSYNEFLKSI